MSDTSSSRNQRIIDELLADAGMEDAGDLRPVLLELRALAAESPRPSAAVEALMAPAATLAAVPATAATLAVASVPPARHASKSAAPAARELAAEALAVDELAARRRRKRRLPLTALSVAAALAAGGAAAAAADENFRHTLGNVGHAVTFVVGTMTSGNAGKTAGQPAPDNGGAVPGSPTPAPTSQVPSPADGGSVPGGQAGGGATADPSHGTARTPGLTLPAKPDPRDPGTIPGTGQLPTGKQVPTPSLGTDPSELVPTPPVELPTPELPSPPPGR